MERPAVDHEALIVEEHVTGPQPPGAPELLEDEHAEQRDHADDVARPGNAGAHQQRKDERDRDGRREPQHRADRQRAQRRFSGLQGHPPGTLVLHDALTYYGTLRAVPG